MDAALRGRESGLVFGENFVIEGENAAGIVGGTGGTVIGLSGNVFEDFVDCAVKLKDGVVVDGGALEMREGEFVVTEFDLQFMGEGDLEGVVATGGAAFEEEFAAIGFDDGLGGEG